MNQPPLESGISRRSFLGAAGAAAVVGSSACSSPAPSSLAQEFNGRAWLAEVRGLTAHNPQISNPKAWSEFWGLVRTGYSDLIFMNPGSHANRPLLVTDSLIADLRRQGLNSHTFNNSAEERIHDFLRPRIGRLVGLPNCSDIYVTVNATCGNQAIAHSTLNNREDEVVLATTEHATTAGIPIWLAKEGRASIQRVELQVGAEASVKNIVDRYAAAVNSRTALVVIPLVSYAEGHLMPIAEIVRAIRKINQSVHIHIDAAHGLGHVPMSISSYDCDSVAMSGHKWAGGPEPTGALWLRRQAKERFAHPLISGGTDVYTVGTGAANLPYFLALDVALELYEAIGPERAWARMMQLRAIASQEIERYSGVEIVSSHHPEVQSAMLVLRLKEVAPEVLARQVADIADTVVVKAMGDFGKSDLRLGFPFSTSIEDVQAGIGLVMKKLGVPLKT